MRYFATTLLLVVVSGSARAQTSPTYRACSDGAKTQAAMNACASDEAARADEQLNDIYRTLLQNNTDTTAATKIKISEEAWIAYRDAYIDAMYPAENKQAEYGSLYPMEIALLRAKLTQIQIAALKDLAQQERKAGRPSAVDLLLVQPMTESEALILKQIGDYQPSRTVNTVVPALHDKGFEKPRELYFHTFYTKTDESVPPPPLAPRKYVWVIVQQYPNSAWAQYFAEYPANIYNSLDDPKHHAIVIQFNNRVRSDQLERSPGQTWIPLYYIWPSGNCVVTVEHFTPDENLEIEGAYLEKYPSSIP